MVCLIKRASKQSIEESFPVDCLYHLWLFAPQVNSSAKRFLVSSHQSYSSIGYSELCDKNVREKKSLKQSQSGKCGHHFTFYIEEPLFLEPLLTTAPHDEGMQVLAHKVPDVDFMDHV